MDTSVPPLAQQEKQEDKKGKLIIDFSQSNEEIDEKLEEWRKWLELETIMDDEVPPPIQQEDDSYSTPCIYDSEQICDEYWKDEEIIPETETIMDNEVPPPVCIVNKYNFGNSLRCICADEVNEEPSWEEEHHCRPVEKLEDGSPLYSKPQEKAREMDQGLLQTRGWYNKKEKLKFQQYHSSHYMPRIRFGPGTKSRINGNSLYVLKW